MIMRRNLVITRLVFVVWGCTLVLMLFASIVLLPSRLLNNSSSCGGGLDSFVLQAGVAAHVDTTIAAIKDKNRQIEDIQQQLRQLQQQQLNEDLTEQETTIQAKNEKLLYLEKLLKKEKQQHLLAVGKIDDRTLPIELDEDVISAFVEAREVDGFRPLRIAVMNHPKSNNFTGDLVLPDIWLLAISYRYGWEMNYYYENRNETIKRDSPIETAHKNLGFFPDQPFPIDANLSEWTRIDTLLPAPGDSDLAEVCSKNPQTGNGFVQCRLLVDDTSVLVQHLTQNGGFESFVTPTFRDLMRTKFMKENAVKIKHYNHPSDYNVAIHVGEEDISTSTTTNDDDTSPLATVARHICKDRPNSTKFHVFSSSNEVNWRTELRNSVKEACSGSRVYFYLGENDGVVLAHLVGADALILTSSKSSVSYVAALLSGGEIYVPHANDFFSPYYVFPHWRQYNSKNGQVLS